MAQVMRLASTDFHCDVNNNAHRTADFGYSRLIVRRGDRFTVTLTFSGRGYESKRDQVCLSVETGNGSLKSNTASPCRCRKVRNSTKGCSPRFSQSLMQPIFAQQPPPPPYTTK
ncbi:hypothetical protein chiPu_0025583 [Chiloscyllium punctatum]|uniref:Transglutaminase N-terminal domain-containing protein n=1 Tax=Chiloscyllium punctatum TaxID=137246 RepID=A0A401TGC6_CHIPU|nr:hypothetical protein [Chiloscyllium punctatum]